MADWHDILFPNPHEISPTVALEKRVAELEIEFLQAGNVINKRDARIAELEAENARLKKDVEFFKKQFNDQVESREELEAARPTEQGVTEAAIDKAVVEAISALQMDQPGRAYDILKAAMEAE